MAAILPRRKCVKAVISNALGIFLFLHCAIDIVRLVVTAASDAALFLQCLKICATIACMDSIVVSTKQPKVCIQLVSGLM